MSANLGRAVLELDVDKSKLRSGLRDAERDTQQSTSKMGSLFGGVGKAAAVGLAGAGVAVAGIAAKGVADFAGFEKQMNEVFTLLPGISADAMGKMEGDVKSFSKEFGTLPNEVVPALYQSLSAGVPQDNVFEFLETAQKAAVGGVTDLTTAVDGISTVINSYGADVIDATQAGDLMFAAVRGGKTTFEELSSSLFNVLPTAASLGIEFGDVTASLATLTSAGVPTAQATTQMRAAFDELSKSNTAVSKTFTELSGVSFGEFIARGGNVQEAMQLLEQHTIDTGLGFKDLFSSSEAGAYALGITGAATEKMTTEMASANDAVGNLDQAFSTMDTGLVPVWNRLKANASVAFLEIGERLAPAIENLGNMALEALPKVVDGFEWILNKAGNLASAISGPLTEGFTLARDSVLTFVQALSGNWEDDSGIHGLHSTVGNFGVLLREQIIPKVLDFVSYLRDDLIPAATEFGSKVLTVIQEDVLPVLTQLGEYIIGTVVPALQDLAGDAWDTFQTDILPVIKDVARLIKDDLFPAAKDFAALAWPKLENTFGWLKDNKDILIAAGVAWAAFTATTQLWAAGSAVASAVSAMPALFAAMSTGVRGFNLALLSPPGIALLLAAIATAIYLIWQNWDTIQPKLQAGWEWFKDAATQLKDWVVGKFHELWDGITGLVDRLLTWLSENWKTLVTGALAILFPPGAGLFLIITNFDTIKAKVSELVGRLRDWLSDRWNDIKTKAVDTWNDIKDRVIGLVSDLRDTVRDTISDARDRLVERWDDIKSKAVNTWDAIKEHISNTKQAMINALKAPFEWLRDNVGGIMTAAANFFLDPLRTAFEYFGTFANGVKNVINWIAEKLNAGSPFGDDSAPGVLIPRVTGAYSGMGPGLAVGTDNWRGGLALTGEEGRELGIINGRMQMLGAKGPELTELPRGSVVVPNPLTEQLLRAGVPGFQFGLNLGFLSDWLNKGKEFVLEQGIKAIGFDGPNLSGAMQDIAGGAFSTVKQWMVDFVKSLLDSMMPMGGAAVEKALAFAESQVGLPYIWGGGHGGGLGGPGIGFDCSGFVAAVLNAGGFPNPGGIVTTFYDWMTKGRSGTVDIGIANPYGSPTEQHMGIGLMGQWFEAGGRAGGVGRTADYFPIIGHPPGLAELLAAEAEKSGGGGGAPFNVGSPKQVQDWLTSAMNATGVPASWLGGLEIIAKHESGYDPNAINLWDINAINGIPSKGLMQTIDPTFLGNMEPGMGDIYNPIHNAAAAINYIRGRYGDVWNVPGVKAVLNGQPYVGYANGGVLPEDIFGLGASGTRYRLHKGEGVIPGFAEGLLPPGAFDYWTPKAARKAGEGQSDALVRPGMFDYWIPASARELKNAANQGRDDELNLSPMIDRWANQAVARAIDEQGLEIYTDRIGGILTGQTYDQLTRDLETLEQHIAFAVAKGWPAAVITALNEEKAGVEAQITKVMADMGVAFGAGLLDPAVAIELGFATQQVLDEGVLSQVAAMMGEMDDAGASLLTPILDAFTSGAMSLEQAASLLPSSVIPSLERLEEQYSVKLVEAMLSGNAAMEADTNATITNITALLDLLRENVEETADAITRFSVTASSGVDQAWFRDTATGKNILMAIPRDMSNEDFLATINTKTPGRFVAMAHGGIITEPIRGLGMHTGTHYLMGERGREHVIPENQMRSQRPITIIVNNPTGEPEDIVAKLRFTARAMANDPSLIGVL